MRLLRRLLKWGLILAVLGVVAGTVAIAVAYWLVAPTLPNVAEIRDMRLQVPLRVLSADGKLIAVFGETRRTPIAIAHIPEQIKQAFIAIEDARFYEHPGIDVVGIARAVWLLASTDRERVPGGSTITQQVARNYFLSPEYSFSRKLSEIFLALKLERELSKSEILELYLNKIFFGYRAYGVVAAADFYYGKTLDQLTLAESAMLAALPKFPSAGNPLNNPQRALMRRNYVLERMHEEGFIDRATRDAAIATPDTAHAHEPPIEVEAPYLAEMVRIAALEQLGADALTAGYVAHTTIDSRLQEAANQAVRQGLANYDRRHGWRGPEARVALSDGASPATYSEVLGSFRAIAGLLPALVVAADADEAQLQLADGQVVVLGREPIRWARPHIDENARGPEPRRVDEVLRRGDVVRLARDADGNWQLAQLPKAQAALVALSPEDGAIKALVGGFSFALSKFNRAIQSNRQPGSSFKPFVYAAAFERGFTPASVVNDAPLTLPDPSRPDGMWRPSNDDGKFEGPMRLREAMVRSRNLVSVRLLDAIGLRYARDYISRFGIPLASLPENLSMALGTTSLPPLAMARGYATFANGGYLVDPYFVARIDDDRGQTVYAAAPASVCRSCPERLAGAAASGAEDLGALLGTIATPARAAAPDPAGARLAPRAIDERTAFLMHSLLGDVIKRGTGRGAMELGRNDLAGKTGTTNEHRDAWFAGWQRQLAAVVWMGIDDFSSLGRGEFASKTAVPVWTEFMRVALDGIPEATPQTPPGISTARIDPASGWLLGSSSDAGTLVEFFRTEDIARLTAQQAEQGDPGRDGQQPFEIF